MSTTLGKLIFGPSPGVVKRIEEMKEQIDRTKSLTAQYNKKFNDLLDFNRQITDSYVNTLNVVVDMSRLITEYRDLTTAILEMLKTFDDITLKDIDPASIQHISNLTSDSMVSIAEFFDKNVKNIKDLFASFGKIDTVNKISDLEGDFQRTLESSQNTYGSLSNRLSRGGRTKRKVSIKKNAKRG